jgi:hypothetical protein
VLDSFRTSPELKNSLGPRLMAQKISPLPYGLRVKLGMSIFTIIDGEIKYECYGVGCDEAKKMKRFL